MNPTDTQTTPTPSDQQPGNQVTINSTTPPASQSVPVNTAEPLLSQPETPSTPHNKDSVTLNTTSVVSKIGLYARVTFFDLWIMVWVTCISLAIILNDSSAIGNVMVFMISVLAITIPIFVIANKKRVRELQINPKLIDDIFLKKYLRVNLFSAIFTTALSLFYAIYSLLSMLFLSSTGSTSDKIKMMLDGLIFAAGFGCILAFSWKQHARTTK